MNGWISVGVFHSAHADLAAQLQPFSFLVSVWQWQIKSRVNLNFFFFVRCVLNKRWNRERGLETEGHRDVCALHCLGKQRQGSDRDQRRGLDEGRYDWRQSALITSPRPPYSVDDYHQRTSEICVRLPWGLSHLGRNLSFFFFWSLYTDLEWLCGNREGTYSHPNLFSSFSLLNTTETEFAGGRWPKGNQVVDT